MTLKIKSKLQQPTIADIASKLSLSVGTVSMALSGNSAIREKTRKRVLATAKILNYKPNLQARSLRTQKTNRIGVVVPDLSDPFYIEKLSRAHSIFNEAGYELVFGNSGWNVEIEKQVCDNFFDQRVDALIVTALAGKTVKHLLPFCENGKPLCVIGDVPTLIEGMIAIKTDIEKGIYQMMKLLIDLGHRRFATLGIIQRHVSRWRGIRSALAENSLSDDQVMSLSINGHNIRSGSEAIHLFINEHGKDQLPTALLVINDSVAAGALSALQQHGVRIPEDISVVGCNNIELASYTVPPLTTLSQSAGRLGQIASELILEQLQNKTTTSRSILEPTELVVRQSTGVAKST